MENIAIISVKTKEEEYRKKKRYWSNVITAWYFSGMSSGTFCKKHDLKMQDFRRWVLRLRLPRPVRIKEEIPEKKERLERIEPIRFIPVEIDDIRKDMKNCENGIEIILSNGVRFWLGRNFDEEVLIRAITLVGGDRC